MEIIQLLCSRRCPLANTTDSLSKSKLLAVYRQSVRLGVRPLETHDQIFFSTELLR
jgi:hypothetical protein